MSTAEFDVAAARKLMRERGLSASEIKKILAQDHLTPTEVGRIRDTQARVARQVLQSWGLEAVARQPGRTGESLFDAGAVWREILARPGKGWRKGQRGIIGEAKPRKVTPEIRAKILKIYSRPPSKAGAAYDRWTFDRLADHLREAGIVDLASETVRRIVRAESATSK